MKNLTHSVCLCAMFLASSVAFANPLAETPTASKGTTASDVLKTGEETSSPGTSTTSSATPTGFTAKDTPEPASLVLLGTGLAAAGLLFRRRKAAEKRD